MTGDPSIRYTWSRWTLMSHQGEHSWGQSIPSRHVIVAKYLRIFLPFENSWICSYFLNYYEIVNNDFFFFKPGLIPLVIGDETKLVGKIRNIELNATENVVHTGRVHAGCWPWDQNCYRAVPTYWRWILVVPVLQVGVGLSTRAFGRQAKSRKSDGAKVTGVFAS